MDIDQRLIGFEINYSGKQFFCEVQIQPFFYKVYCNNKYMADIEYDASSGWVQTNGTILPNGTIEEISAHIDGQLD